MSWPWASKFQQIWIRSFKWGTIKLSKTIYRKVIGCQSSWSKIIRISWSLPGKIAMLKWGPGSIPGLGELWRLVNLQYFILKGSIVSHLKDLIHICLEPDGQARSQMFRIVYTKSKYPHFSSYRGKTSVYCEHSGISLMVQLIFFLNKITYQIFATLA